MKFKDIFPIRREGDEIKLDISRLEGTFCALQNQVNQLFDDAVSSAGIEDLVRPGGKRAFRPAVSVVEETSTITVKAEVPGLGHEEVGVEILADTLVLAGKKQEEENSEEEGRKVYSERKGGEFSRTIHLGCAVVEDGIAATLRNGILTVVIPKAAPSEPEPEGRRITVSAE